MDDQLTSVDNPSWTRAALDFFCAKLEATMRYGAFALVTLLTILGSKASFAAYCEGGQQPAPPELAARMALPECGFAATETWGSNGCQLCDARNMYSSAPARRPLRHR
jgi:hypothetical protein